MTNKNNKKKVKYSNCFLYFFGVILGLSPYHVLFLWYRDIRFQFWVYFLAYLISLLGWYLNLVGYVGVEKIEWSAPFRVRKYLLLFIIITVVNLSFIIYKYFFYAFPQVSDSGETRRSVSMIFNALRCSDLILAVVSIYIAEWN